MRVQLALLLVLVSGCGEDWYASDELEMPFVGPGVVAVRVTTTPEAWPDRLYSNAVRASFDGCDITLVDPNHEILQGGRHWVNVLDAWDACEPGTFCEATFEFAVDCEQACEGTFFVDAYLSTQHVPEPDRGGSVTLEWVEEPVVGG